VGVTVLFHHSWMLCKLTFAT